MAVKAKIVGYIVVESNKIVGRGASASDAIKAVADDVGEDVGYVIKNINEESNWELIEVRRSLKIDVVPAEVTFDKLEEIDFEY